MSELSKSELVSYLREVFRLEHKKQTISTECNKIQNEINEIEDKTYANEPHKNYYDLPKKPEKKLTTQEKGGVFRVAILVFIVVLFGGAQIVDFIVEILYSNVSKEIYVDPTMGAFVLFIVAVLMCVICGIVYKSHCYNKKMSKYNQKMEEYNQNVQQAEKRYNADMFVWKKNCALVDDENARRQSARVYKNSIKNQLLNIVPEIDKSLNKLYSYDILHRNYRNYKAVGYILLYFETGRVDTLKEAINKYEDELFKGMVVEALDEIAFNQELTYDAIRENNMLIQGATSNIGTIISQNEKISDYQQLAAANSKDILDSVQNIDFRQTIEMLDRYASN